MKDFPASSKYMYMYRVLIHTMYRKISYALHTNVFVNFSEWTSNTQRSNNTLYKIKFFGFLSHEMFKGYVH